MSFETIDLVSLERYRSGPPHDLFERLRREAPVVRHPIEEMLRWVSPVMHFRRTLTRDVEAGGRILREGDKVVVFHASADRDAEVFAEPERFDVARSPGDHVAFGRGGTHSWLGADLARLEARALFAEILARMPKLRPNGPVERLKSNFIHGPRRMPVSLAADGRR